MSPLLPQLLFHGKSYKSCDMKPGEGWMALRVTGSRGKVKRSQVLPPSLGNPEGRRMFIPVPSPEQGLQCETPDLNQNL